MAGGGGRERRRGKGEGEDGERGKKREILDLRQEVLHIKKPHCAHAS